MNARKIWKENTASESAASLFNPPIVGNPERRFGDFDAVTSRAPTTSLSILFRILISPIRWFHFWRKSRKERASCDFFYHSEREAFRVEHARKLASARFYGAKF
jgi:hypothetical protein